MMAGGTLRYPAIPLAQTFTEDFVDPKKPREKRCQLIRSTPYLCNAVMGSFFHSRQPR